MNQEVSAVGESDKGLHLSEIVPIGFLEGVNRGVIVLFEDRRILSRIERQEPQFVIAEQGTKAVLPGDLDDPPGVGSPIDEIAEENHRIVRGRFDLGQEFLELPSASVNVANDDGSCGHNGGLCFIIEGRMQELPLLIASLSLK